MGFGKSTIDVKFPSCRVLLGISETQVPPLGARTLTLVKVQPAKFQHCKVAIFLYSLGISLFYLASTQRNGMGIDIYFLKRSGEMI